MLLQEFVRSGALHVPKRLAKRQRCIGGAGVAGSFASRAFTAGSSADPRTLSSASKLLAWWRASQLVTPNLTLAGSGSSPPVVTWQGTGPVAGLLVEVNDTTGGTLRGQAKFRYSLQSGAAGSFISGVLTGASVPLVGADITLNFANNPYTNNNVYEPVAASWVDGQAAHALLQPSADSGARMRVNVIGGREALYFDGVRSIMLCADGLANSVIGGLNKPFTILAVAVVTDPTIGVIVGFNNTAGTGFFDYGGQGGAPFCNKHGDSDSVHSATGGTLSTAAHLNQLLQSGTNAQCSIDTVSQFSLAQTATTLTSDVVSVGATYINGVPANRGAMYVAELLLYNGVLTAPELAELSPLEMGYYSIPVPP
jgi:hypothetical protein